MTDTIAQIAAAVTNGMTPKMRRSIGVDRGFPPYLSEEFEGFSILVIGSSRELMRKLFFI
jgi:hypothetical protein